jgi:hypothetical protein
MKKKIITHLFSFSDPSFFFSPFSLDAGLANQLKPRISQKQNLQECAPQCTKKGQIISLLGHYLFTWQIIMVANVGR